MYFNSAVGKVFIFVIFGLVSSQNEGLESTISPELKSLADEEAASDLICRRCNCTEPGVVTCSERELTDFFEIQDWDGLKPFAPVTVDLSLNPLTTITRISSLPIATLNFSHCEISTIEDGSFVYLADLVTLDLSHNKITTSALSRRIFSGVLIPKAGLLPFSKARTVSLAHNDIHSLPADLFGWMPSLTRLELSGNPLAFIDQVTMAAITDLVNLRELYLDGCELESLPEGLFRRPRRLLSLDLSDNRFTTVPSVLIEAINLQYLNFGKNTIQVLPTENVIRNLTKLQDLRLSRNSKLQTIEAQALGGLPNLVSLHITYNPRLTTIHPDFLVFTDDHDTETWPMLTEFLLANNNITKIDSGYLHRWDQLVRSDFANNPYVCDCRNQWVVDVLTPLLNREGAQNGENMICTKPAELRGMSFTQLHASHRTLLCPENNSLMDIPVPDTAIVLGIMIGIFVTFPIVLVVVLLWRKGYFVRCRTRKVDHDDEETDAF